MLYLDIFSRKNRVQDIIQVYHQSQFPEYTPLIEELLKESGSKEKIALSNVVCGVITHHIPIALPLLVEFYTKLKNTREIKTFIILGPDHVDGGRGDISVSRAHFVTPFGILEPNLAVVESLEKSGFVVNDESPFEKEHSVGSQLPLISKLFPDAKIVPLIFRSSSTNDFAREFGKILATFLNDDTFIIASVDFSHYFPEKQARPIDRFSANAIGSLDTKLTGFIEADSTQVMTALVSALEVKGIDSHADLRVSNTADFDNNSDFTTGYVTAFFGTK